MDLALEPEPARRATDASGRLEDHNGDLAGGGGFVGGEAGVVLLLMFPDRGTFGAGGRPGAVRVRLGADFGGDVGVSDEVVVPGGVGVRSGFGREDR